MKEKIEKVFIITIFPILGVISSIAAHYKAQAAVKLRPNLETMSWGEACLTNHCGDWLFYFHPKAAAAILIIMFTSFGVVIFLIRYK